MLFYKIPRGIPSVRHHSCFNSKYPAEWSDLQIWLPPGHPLRSRSKPDSKLDAGVVSNTGNYTDNNTKLQPQIKPSRKIPQGAKPNAQSYVRANWTRNKYFLFSIFLFCDVFFWNSLEFITEVMNIILACCQRCAISKIYFTSLRQRHSTNLFQQHEHIATDM